MATIAVNLPGSATVLALLLGVADRPNGGKLAHRAGGKRRGCRAGR